MDKNIEKNKSYIYIEEMNVSVNGWNGSILRDDAKNCWKETTRVTRRNTLISSGTRQTYCDIA